MPPAYLTLKVTRVLGDVVQQDEYRISTIGGTVGGLPGPSAGGSRYEVTWRGDSLWIYNESYGPSGANIRRRGEIWRIDERGRLVIEIETREKDEAAVTRTFVYRRETLKSTRVYVPSHFEESDPDRLLLPPRLRWALS